MKSSQGAFEDLQDLDNKEKVSENDLLSLGHSFFLPSLRAFACVFVYFFSRYATGHRHPRNREAGTIKVSQVLFDSISSLSFCSFHGVGKFCFS